MAVNFNFNNFISSINSKSLCSDRISFKSRDCSKNDSFEKTSNVKNFQMSLYNPYSESSYSSNVSVDLSKPQKIVIKGVDKPWRKSEPLVLDYDPNRTDFILDKLKGEPVKVVILKSTNNEEKYSYHFMSENLEKEYGYVELSNRFDLEEERLTASILDCPLLLDYPEYGIVGPRVTVNYLKNQDDKHYGGIGKLADKLSVKHCLENNIKPIIVSIADKNSHAAHYLRGKRFLPLYDDSCAKEFFHKRYGSDDLNKIMENLIKQSKQTDEKINVKGWGYLPIYMPQDIVQKYEKQIKSEKKQ